MVQNIAHPDRHVIVADSYYGNLDVAEELHSKDFRFLLACQNNRPAFLFSDWLVKITPKGSTTYCSNGHLLALTFHDRKPFSLITNCIRGNVSASQQQNLSLAVQTYRENYGHVDRFDNQSTLYLTESRSTKWTQAYFKTNAMFVLLNSMRMYNCTITTPVVKLEYMQMIIKAIKMLNHPPVPRPVKGTRHFPQPIKKQRLCQQCKKSKTSYACDTCENALHIHCWILFHDTEKK